MIGDPPMATDPQPLPAHLRWLKVNLNSNAELHVDEATALRALRGESHVKVQRRSYGNASHPYVLIGQLHEIMRALGADITPFNPCNVDMTLTIDPA